MRKSDSSSSALPGLCLAAVVLAAAFLLLWRLDRPLLWQDEAETANVALNLLGSGLPTPWDGDHLVTQQHGRDALRLGDRLLWAWHPWPQHYLATAGLAFAGEEATPAGGSVRARTVAARLPFALLALLTVPLVYRWRRPRDGWATATVATAIYALSIGFVLYGRQCRYYALLYLGGVIALWAYDRLGSRSGAAGGGRSARRLVGPAPARTVASALGLALVFYANPLSGVALGAGIGIHSLVAARERLGAVVRAGGLLTLLAAHARGLRRLPRAVVASYGWESLHFYLGVPVTGPSLQRPARTHLGLPQIDRDRIDLVIPRRGRPRPGARLIGPSFIQITLPVPDDAYENLPDLTAARFRPSDLPPLAVWTREELLPPKTPSRPDRRHPQPLQPGPDAGGDKPRPHTDRPARRCVPEKRYGSERPIGGAVRGLPAGGVEGGRAQGR